MDDLVERGEVECSRDPGWIERRPPWLLDRQADPRARRLLRAVARLHAAIVEVEPAVAGDGGDRWPWWAAADDGGARTRMGAPLVSLTASCGSWVPELGLSRRTAAR